jgi:phage terminase large subunit-like protein
VKNLADFLEQVRYQKALTFDPLPKQRTFFDLGASARKRCAMAANQVGKSTMIAFELRCHLTGLYPGWWQGRRFDGAVRVWVGGPDAMHVRDNMQRQLFGQMDELGSGMIERHLIEKVQRQAGGVQNAIDYGMVRHKTGTLSFVKFKSYDQQLDKWSGDTLAIVAYDEEPPEAHYAEGLTRTNYGDNGRPGIVMIAMTPLLGMTEVARRFYPHPRESDAALVQMGLRDALQYREEDIPRIIEGYKEHERRARVEGKPQLGEGAVFPFDFDQPDIWIEPPERLRWWLYTGGLDFGGAGGGSHPSAAVEIGWDREADCIYVLREHRAKGATIAEFCSPLRRWSPVSDLPLPFAWPHDGHMTDRRGGGKMKLLYEAEGLLLLHEHATFEGRLRDSLEDSVSEIHGRLAGRQLKISRSCPLLREELEGYRREKGKIVQEYDDLISALRYAVMSKNMGASAWRSGRERVPIVGLDYDPLEM